MTDRPLILIDVDGVLNPEFSSKERRRLRRHHGWIARHGYQSRNRFPLFLNPRHGPRLWRLAEETGAELAWATTWNENANSQVGRWLGLPTLPVAPAKRYSKAETVVPWTEGRPFVWLDDEPYIVEDCARLATQPHLVVPVNPHVGLTFPDLMRTYEWLSEQEWVMNNVKEQTA